MDTFDGVLVVIIVFGSALAWTWAWHRSGRTPPPHECEFPSLDDAVYGERWECPVCRRAYVMEEFDDEHAWWNREEA